MPCCACNCNCLCVRCCCAKAERPYVSCTPARTGQCQNMCHLAAMDSSRAISVDGRLCQGCLPQRLRNCVKATQNSSTQVVDIMPHTHHDFELVPTMSVLSADSTLSPAGETLPMEREPPLTDQLHLSLPGYPNLSQSTFT